MHTKIEAIISDDNLKKIKLTDAQRRIICMKKDGLTHQVIADTLGTTRQNVDRVLSVVIGKLRNYHDRKQKENTVCSLLLRGVPPKEIKNEYAISLSRISNIIKKNNYHRTYIQSQ